MAAEAAPLPSHWRVMLQCPIHHTPLIDAELLFPCMHRVCSLCTNILSQQTGYLYKACPLKHCERLVEAHSPDPLIRDIVRDVLSQTKEITEAGDAPPFRNARFVCTKPWGPIESKSDSNSCIFRSVTENPLFTEFIFKGFEDGTLGLFIQFNPDYAQLVRDSMLEQGYSCSEGGFYFVQALLVESTWYRKGQLNGTDKIKKLFEVFVKENHLPEEDLPWIRRFLEDGKWKEPPPPPEPSLFQKITSYFTPSEHGHHE